MMYYTKAPPKLRLPEQQIQPWGSDETKMMNLIIESAEMQAKHAKHFSIHSSEQKKLEFHTPRKEGQSYNFYTNLRKYERKKAEDYMNKKDVNFIERNIKGLTQDFTEYHDVSPNSKLHKLINQKQDKEKSLSREYKQTIQPINWSLIMQYQQGKSEKRPKHKAIQSFMRFQSQKMEKAMRKQSIDDRVDNIEEMSQSQGDQYQKLLKLREGLRKRNLKSSEDSKKLVDKSLNIEESWKSSKSVNSTKYQFFQKNFIRTTPKTRESLRKANTNATIKVEDFNEPATVFAAVKFQRSDPRHFYTSHRNRISVSKKLAESKLQSK